jgi:hypothetical protein
MLDGMLAALPDSFQDSVQQGTFPIDLKIRQNDTYSSLAFTVNLATMN